MPELPDIFVLARSVDAENAALFAGVFSQHLGRAPHGADASGSPRIGALNPGEAHHQCATASMTDGIALS